MTPRQIKEKITEMNPNALFADGFDRALMGYIDSGNGDPVALYNSEKCIDILMKDGSSYEDANDYLCCNVLCAYVGENGPMFADVLSNNAKKTQKSKKKKSKSKGEELFIF